MIRTVLTLAAIVVVIALALGAVSLYERPTEPVTPSTTEYRNTTHGYALSYPSTLEIVEQSPEQLNIRRVTDSGVEELAGVRVVTITAEQGESFLASATRSLADLCSESGPDASFSCTGVDRSGPFLSRTGGVGYEAYLTGTHTTLSTGDTEAVVRGPYYAFLMSGSATVSKVLVLYPRTLNADAATITSIAQSVVLNSKTVETTNIEAYVTENISRLSPEPEVLGGTYYVTAIEASASAGTVSYEDGHNAYTADFTYTQGPTGVSVDSFVIRPQ